MKTISNMTGLPGIKIFSGINLVLGGAGVVGMLFGALLAISYELNIGNGFFTNLNNYILYIYEACVYMCIYIWFMSGIGGISGKFWGIRLGYISVFSFATITCVWVISSLVLEKFLDKKLEGFPVMLIIIGILFAYAFLQYYYIQSMAKKYSVDLKSARLPRKVVITAGCVFIIALLVFRRMVYYQ